MNYLCCYLNTAERPRYYGVNVNVPALLKLNVLNAEGLYADKVTNKLIRREIQSRSSEGT